MTHHIHFASYKKILAFFSAVIFMLTSCFITSYAAAVSGISISAIIPENQVDTSKTYFDLRLAPGQKQIIQIMVRNGSDEAVNAYVDINNASTGRNGLIQYNVPNIRDDSLVIPIVDIARAVTPKVAIPAKSEALVDIELNMPDKTFDGCILGGIVVTAEAQNEAAETETEGNMQIRNNYAYAVGLKIIQNDNEVKPDMHLKNINPGLVNYRPMVEVRLQNSEAAIIKGMHIEAQVFKKGSSEIFKQMSMPDVDMAPCSSFDAGIDWNDKRLEPGVYRLKMRAEHEDQVWEWDEEFTIQNNQANKINTDSVYMEPQGSIWQYAHTGICFLALVLFIVFLLNRRKRREESV